MKVALVHYTAAPVVGGVERVMEEHARILSANGHAVKVVCLRGGEEEAARLPADESPDAQAAALRRVLEGQEVAVLHNVMTMPFHPGLTEALWRMIDELPGVRFIAWLHDVAARNPDYPQVAPLFRRAHPRCEYVAVSPLVARHFSDATGEPAARCRVIPNGVNPARVLGLPPGLAELVKRHDLLDGRLLLLHPARIVRRKNVALSLALGRELSRRGIAATVLVTAATDPHNTASHTLGEELRREFAGSPGHLLVGDHLAVDECSLAGLYRLADALLFPSQSEGFGLPLLEAALHRLPVFCSDIEPLRDLLREVAVTFPPDATPAEIADLVVRGTGASPAWRERRRILTEYAWPAIFRRHLAPLLAGTHA